MRESWLHGHFYGKRKGGSAMQSFPSGSRSFTLFLRIQKPVQRDFNGIREPEPGQIRLSVFAILGHTTCDS